MLPGPSEALLLVLPMYEPMLEFAQNTIGLLADASDIAYAGLKVWQPKIGYIHQVGRKFSQNLLKRLRPSLSWAFHILHLLSCAGANSRLPALLLAPSRIPYRVKGECSESREAGLKTLDLTRWLT